MNAAYRLSPAAVLCALLLATPAAAQNIQVTAGANHDIDFNQEIDVPFSGFAGQWFLNVDLQHDPSAGPMIKRLASPMDDTGQPILLDAQQRFPVRIDEVFNLVPSIVALPPGWNDISDWHEEILTPGFVWVLPSDADAATIFPPNTPLLTKNGDPHPWEFIPSIALPNRLDIKFPALGPGDQLGITKALEWIGTPGNRIWGDHQLDDGTPLDESVIRVWEYPTIPEPTSLLLALSASGAMLRWRG